MRNALLRIHRNANMRDFRIGIAQVTLKMVKHWKGRHMFGRQRDRKD